MRNNVNNNGLINGGYTNNNQNVNQILYFNQEVQPVQLSTSPFIAPQTFIGSPQQLPYQSMYNQIPNYYNMGVMNYSQPQNAQYGSMLMKPNNFSGQVLPSRLDIVDPNTGSNIVISRPSTPVSVPKRRSTLQIIDPVSKNEIDVYKIAMEVVTTEVTQVQLQNEKDKKDLKFEFDTKITEEIINQPKEKSKNKSLLDEINVEEEKIEMEIIPETLIEPVNEVEEKTEVPKETEDKFEEQELQTILYELKKDEEEEDEFTEVVNKKKKKQQTKMLIQEQRAQEVKATLQSKKEMNNRHQNGNNKKENREKSQKNVKPKPSTPNDDNKETGNNLPEINRSGNRFFRNDRFERNNQRNEPANRNFENTKLQNNHRNGPNQFQADIASVDKVKRNESRNGQFNRNDNRNISGQNNEGRNASISRNESRNTSIQRNESRNTSIQRNESRNTSIQRNESRNTSIQRNESRNTSIQRNENRNTSIQRNESRNTSIQRNESRNTSIQRNESRNTSIQRNENRNTSGQNNEGRNTSIHRNESRNKSGQNNEERNARIHHNENRNTNEGNNIRRNPRSQKNEERHVFIQRHESRKISGENDNNRNVSGQNNERRNASIQRHENRLENGLDTNENMENRSATLPRMNSMQWNDTHNGYRQGYNRNRNNNNNQNYNGDQCDNRPRNGQGMQNRMHYNRSDNYRPNNSSNNNNRRDNNADHTEDSVYVNSNTKPESFKAPFKIQRAFRKSSSPLYGSSIAGNTDTERLVESPLLQTCSPTPIGDDILITDSRSDEMVVDGLLSEAVVGLEIGRDAFVDEVDVFSVMDVEKNLPSDDTETLDKVVDALVVELEMKATDSVEIYSTEPTNQSEIESETKFSEEKEEIIDSDVMETELEINENEIEPEIIPKIEEIKPEIEEMRSEIEEMKPEIEEMKSEIEEMKPEIEEMKPEIEEKNSEAGEKKLETGDIKPVESELGRLTYYRENLLALRGSQTLPEPLFLDPVLMEVINAKMQLINFLKKKEIFVPVKPSRTDYLDFTRRHHNIRPKRFIRTENGYLPPQLRKADEDKLKQLKRNIKSILNKMTPENFEVCLSDLVNLEIDEEENMRCLIDEIFSKAIQEVSYSSIYARFCSEMSNARVGNYSFKALLLKSCQTMFDKSLHLQLEEVKTFWETKAANEKDERMKRLYESDIEEQVKKAKDKYFGNIRFFSELFLSNQLSWKIIISCAEKLLMFSKDNNSLEAACQLMEICGKQLEKLERERTNGDKAFSKVMNQFVVLSKNIDIEPRLRFKLKDVVDMRERGWELRGIQKAMNSVPKTLDEIKEDKQKEDSIKIKTNYNPGNNMNNNNNNNMRNRQPYPRPVMDTKKLLVNPQNLSENTVLGPSLRTQWNAGCQSKSNNSNGFSTIPSRKQVTYDDIIDKPIVIKTQNKYAKLCEEFEVELPPPVPVKVNNDETLTTELFDLLMNNLATVDKWKELFNPVEVVEKWFALMFERKVECRMRIGDYFHDLIEEGLLTFDQLIQGASVTTETVDDIIDDVPKFWEFLAQFLERFIRNEHSNISFFKDLFKDIEGYESAIEKCYQFTQKFSSSRINSDIVEDLFRKLEIK